MQEFRIDRLNRLMADIGVQCDGLFVELDCAYGEASRFYHSREHIDDCLVKFDTVRDELVEPDLVEYAIWFHDAIYDVRALDNEEKSAEWAVRVLRQSGIVQDAVGIVEELITATKSHESFSSDSAYLLDIDLSILGGDAGIFRRYDENIRREYAHVDEVTYASARTKVLRSFLNRERIYLTEYFYELFEERARLNLNSIL